MRVLLCVLILVACAFGQSDPDFYKAPPPSTYWPLVGTSSTVAHTPTSPTQQSWIAYDSSSDRTTFDLAKAPPLAIVKLVDGDNVLVLDVAELRKLASYCWNCNCNARRAVK